MVAPGSASAEGTKNPRRGDFPIHGREPAVKRAKARSGGAPRENSEEGPNPKRESPSSSREKARILPRKTARPGSARTRARRERASQKARYEVGVLNL